MDSVPFIVKAIANGVSSAGHRVDFNVSAVSYGRNSIENMITYHIIYLISIYLTMTRLTDDAQFLNSAHQG